MSDRRRMRIGDWLNGAAFLAIGVFLGLAADGMAGLAGTAFWPMIVIIPVLFGGVFLFVSFFDRVIDRIFPGGVKPASRARTKERKPLVLLLSLPTGIAFGMIGARLGLGKLLL